MRKINWLLIFFLVIGVLYRILPTLNNQFLFNMDNGRDMVDVREMVELKKIRLIGPTSAVQGLFNGPAWYYLLAIPYILSGGNPDASIIMEIILWAIGGIFLFKLVERFGFWAKVLSLSVWVASNYIYLATLYAFNPNPVVLLTPLLIFLIEKYIHTGKFIYSVSMWFLSGFFFNFEMNFAIFLPIIIFSIVFLTKRKLLKTRTFWVSTLGFVAMLLPQILFDFRHGFIMSKAVVKYLSATESQNFDLWRRTLWIYKSFYETLSGTLMNKAYLSFSTATLVIFYSIGFFKNRLFANTLASICISFIMIPFWIYVFLPMQVNPWHLGAIMVSVIILLIIILDKLFKSGILSKLVAFVIFTLMIFSTFGDVIKYFVTESEPNNDVSLLANEIAAIDYVYKKAEGKNFKVYTYLPSVYDYPYQYLFWWHGRKTYGYVPGEYVYSPDKPQYIPSQDKFQGSKENFSGLVFLIKEPPIAEPRKFMLRDAWAGDFDHMEFISKEMVGPLEVEIRRESL